jgi:hypothetical protein
MRFDKIISNFATNQKLSRFRNGFIFLSFCIISIISFYCLKAYGVACHFEEWTGRGLYPAVAFTHGFDLYERTTGPLVTLYGFGTALFYSPVILAQNPNTGIWIAYFCNLLGLSLPLGFILRKLISANFQTENNFRLYSAVFLILVIIIFTLQLEPTTLGTLKIHADTPAISFILLGIVSFIKYKDSNRKIFLFFSSLFLTLSVWAKLPALPAVILPVILLLFNKENKNCLVYIFFTALCFAFVAGFVFLKYGFSDVWYYLYEFPSESSWSYRDNLFNGKNAILMKHGYFEGIPLIFRFFVMYLQDFWYIFAAILLVLGLAFKKHGTEKIIFLSISLMALISLPTCLAHLARFGAVENALIFTNFFGIICILLLIFSVLQNISPKFLNINFLIIFSFILLLPIFRICKSLPNSTAGAPHQQAYDYLVSGKSDVYFGWYPISHVLHSGNNITCIEVPTWVGMNKPKSIDFGMNHIPKEAKYMATGMTGYGSTVLEQYLGDLEEAERPSELSGWRLFEIKGKTLK